MEKIKFKKEIFEIWLELVYAVNHFILNYLVLKGNRLET